MEENIWKHSDTSSTAPLGRVMNTLLGCSAKHLEAAISRVDLPSQRNSGVMLDDSLRYVREYARDAIEQGEQLDHILIPMIENSLKSNGSKRYRQVLVLLKWLFQEEFLLQTLSSNLSKIIMRKEDNYIALGWCILVRGLVEHELIVDQITDAGKQEKCVIILSFLSQSMPHISSVISKGSILQDSFELPTRLAVAAADCMLVLSEALTQKAHSSKVPRTRTESTDLTNSKKLVTLVSGPISSGRKERNICSQLSNCLDDMELGLLLWHNLDELIFLVQKLQAWSRKSRPLHAKGLEQVLKWLQGLRGHYDSLKDETGEKTLKTGLLLLSSCWKQYGMLLHLVDNKFPQHYRETLEQYISAIQYCTQDQTEGCPGKKSGSMETKKFFLNCLCLLWGRLDNKQLEITMSEYGRQMVHLLLSQLLCSDEIVVEVSVSMLKAIIFQTNISSTCTSLHDFSQMEEVLPLLMNLLDDRDSTSRAIVLLAAEFCSVNPGGQSLKEIFKRLDGGNECQKKNAIDVLSEFLHIAMNLEKPLSLSLREDIAKHLLECLGDEEQVIRVGASNLLPQIDPILVLPALIRRMYSLDERMQSAASDAILAVLKYHNQNADVIVMLLNCLSNLTQTSCLSETTVDIESGHSGATSIQSGSKLDMERVFCLIPKWAESVQDWRMLVEPLIDKMFLEPSNSVMVRFLSRISENLTKAKDVVLHQILSRMQEQEKDVSLTCDDSPQMNGSLFDRLCPLLILRLLPLNVFGDLTSFLMYGQILTQDYSSHDYSNLNISKHDCVAALLLHRASQPLEFEDVRKLAAELCGRLHPKVLLPVIISQLDNATNNHNILKLKACLFTICTSLVVRGKESALHPVMVKIRKILETVLLWHPLDDNEVSKAQHGCIDCLALMICAELQMSEPLRDSQNDAQMKSSVLGYVIQQLTCEQNGARISKSEQYTDSQLGIGNAREGLTVALIPLSFRLCMANVLISVCQKILNSGKISFARGTLPVLIQSTEMVGNAEVRAACLQVLFSAVYHLKSAVLPYSPELFNLSLKALKKGSEKEKIAGAKLMASLMGGEDAIVESIGGGLLHAKSVLSSASVMNSSPELRQLCEKLLVCITSPL